MQVIALISNEVASDNFFNFSKYVHDRPIQIQMEKSLSSMGTWHKGKQNDKAVNRKLHKNQLKIKQYAKS